MTTSSTLAVAVAACLMTIAPAVVQTSSAEGSAAYQKARDAAEQAYASERGDAYRGAAVPAAPTRNVAPNAGAASSADVAVPYRGGREY